MNQKGKENTKTCKGKTQKREKIQKNKLSKSIKTLRKTQKKADKKL